MKLDLTPEYVKTVEIALNELFNSDRWINGREESDIDKIADRAQYLLHVIENHNKNNTVHEVQNLQTCCQKDVHNSYHQRLFHTKIQNRILLVHLSATRSLILYHRAHQGSIFCELRQKSKLMYLECIH